MATLQSDCLRSLGNPEILGKFVTKDGKFCVLHRFPDHTPKYRAMLLSVKGEEFLTERLFLGQKDYADAFKRAEKERYRISTGEMNIVLDWYTDIFTEQRITCLINEIGRFKPWVHVQYIVLANALLEHDKTLLEQSISWINEVFEKVKVHDLSS